MLKKLKKKKIYENLLEHVPVKNNSHISEKIEDDSKLTLIVKRDSKVDRVFLKIFRKAHKEVYVHLDDIGTYTWNKINGKYTVLELAKEFSKDYKISESEAIYRMGTFIKILKNNNFIQCKLQNELQY